MSTFGQELRSLEDDPRFIVSWDRGLSALRRANLSTEQLESARRRLLALKAVPGGYCEAVREQMVEFIEVKLNAGRPGGMRGVSSHPGHDLRPPQRDTDDRKTHLRLEVQRRQIHSLLHFTQAANLPSIVSRGILPRAELERLRIRYKANDDLRLDGLLGGCSVSISWPNYQMFYRYRCRHPEQSWVVIELMPDILWDLECAYSWANAASSLIRPIPLSEMKTLQSFTKMFVDQPNRPCRQTCELEPFHPTDPQAEVLVFAPIPMSSIRAIHARERLPAGCVTGSAASLVVIDGAFFGPRHDYALWRATPRDSSEEVDG